jgi:flagellar FliL protein
MSAATATADAGAPPAKGKKKLILIIVAAVVVLALGGVGALLLLKKNSNVDDEEADGGHAADAKPAAHARDPKHPPAFVPLEVFTVNLADKEADRYAQVGITLELDDPATAEAIKVFMPAIRNNILMVLAHKSAKELLEHDGKTRLAEEIRRETARGMGIEVEDSADAEDEDRPSSKKKRKKREPAPLPVSAVYFSTFIIQ